MVRFGSIVDLHFRNDVSAREVFVGAQFRDQQWRIYSTASVRFSSAVAQFNSSNVDWAIQLGDAVDSHLEFAGTDSALAIAGVSAMSQMAAIADTFDGTFYHAWGNHEDAAIFNGTLNPEADFWNTISANSSNFGSRANAYQEDGTDRAYYFEDNINRYVVLFETTGGVTVSQDQLDWISATALATMRPTFIFGHGSLVNNPLFNYPNVTNASAITSILASNGNVQGVFTSHFHRSTIAGFGAEPSIQVIDGIPHIQLRGSVLGPEDGDSSARDSSASVYYEIDIRENAYGPNKSNIEVNAFLQGIDKPFESFAI